MITLKNINKYFFKHKKNQIHVISNTSLELGQTGLVALLGPSGSGKTTLLNAIGGLDKIDSGSIEIDGKKMPRRSNTRKDSIRVIKIGYIFQDYNLLDHLSVFENVALSLKMIGINNKEEIKTKVEYILELVDMYRYRNKLAGNLSGGQRQRVGIARALVKDPDVIIADEPTGNLDSKNTIEIMNIIKKISLEKLVILVTHEKDLAHFYASRIIELIDGKIVNDYSNDHENELDYRIDNKIYLKDFEYVDKMNNKGAEIALYSNKKEKLRLDIVVKDGNIFIKSPDNEKIEIVDDNSAIEFIDDHYKKIKRDDFDDREYDLNKLKNDKRKIHYASIYNLKTMLKTGFKKVTNYTIMKKILLFGFFFAAMFIMYALSNIFGVITIKDENFLNAHRDYIMVENNKNKVEDFLDLENRSDISYVIPGNSQVAIQISNPKILQLSGLTKTLSGSIASLEVLAKDAIVHGTYPKNSNEIVIDKNVIDQALVNDETIKWLDLHSYEDYIGLEAKVDKLSFKIVGISDTEDPCIYVSKDKLIDVIALSSDPNMEFDYTVSTNSSIKKYELYKDDLTLVEGRLPSGDYETIVDVSNREFMPIGKSVPYKIGDIKLKVVGYYTSNVGIYDYVVGANTFKYETIAQNSNMLIIGKDKSQTIEKLVKEGYVAYDNYDVLKKKYIENAKESIKESLILAGILLAISFIEIYLMIRASFLSRVKETGIYRAIGVKKTDIYKMFLGEILIITTFAGLPGAILMSSILKEISSIKFFGNMFIMNPIVFTLGILLIYFLYIFVGLLPIRSTIIKTPAEILARNDVN